VFNSARGIFKQYLAFALQRFSRISCRLTRMKEFYDLLNINNYVKIYYAEIASKIENNHHEISENDECVSEDFPHYKKVSDYLLGSTIGEGSFAKVRVGLHLPTKEKVRNNKNQ